MTQARMKGQPQVDTTSAHPRDVTDQFRYQYEDAWKKLQDKSEQMDRNRELSEFLRVSGQSDLANQIQRCNAIYAGNSHDTLRPIHYCRKTAFCHNCSEVLAQKRADHWLEACDQFVHDIDNINLVYHKFLIRPNTAGTFDNPISDFKISLKLLQTFKKVIKRTHDERSVGRLQRGKIAGKTSRDRKKKVWGPSVSAIHIVPRRHGKNEDPFAHMHLTIVTSDRAKKQDLTNLIKHAWQTNCSNSRIYYSPTTEEVTRERIYRKENKLEGRNYSFQPIKHDDEDHNEQYNAVKNHFAYLSRPLKQHYSPLELVAAHDLLEDFGMSVRQLRQKLGFYNGKTPRVCASFPRNKSIEAHYNTLGWQVFSLPQNKKRLRED